MIHPAFGPMFQSFDGTELGVYCEPFNDGMTGQANQNKCGYKIPNDDSGKNMLTNDYGGGFRISELEVWHVKYLD